MQNVTITNWSESITWQGQMDAVPRAGEIVELYDLAGKIIASGPVTLVRWSVRPSKGHESASIAKVVFDDGRAR